MKKAGRYLVGAMVAAAIASGTVLLVHWLVLEPTLAKTKEQHREEVEGALGKISDLLEEDLQQRLQGLLNSAPADEILLALARQGSIDEVDINVAADWMKISGLSVMTLADSTGKILSCGHLSGSNGEHDAEILELAARQHARGVLPLAVRQGGEIRKTLALVAVARRELESTGLLLLGGWRLDGELLCSLERLSGTALRVVDAEGRTTVPECEHHQQRLVNWDAEPTWRLPLFGESCPPRKRFWLQVVMTGQRPFRWRPVMVAAALVAFLLAVLVSWLLGRRLNRNT